MQASMKHRGGRVSPVRHLLIMVAWGAVAVAIAGLSGCAVTKHVPLSLPPIMTQDELQRPYVKLGALEYSRSRIGSVEGLTTQDYEWAYGELREGARRLGADAVILPEVRVEQSTYLLFPSGEIKAKGIAIQFR